MKAPGLHHVKIQLSEVILEIVKLHWKQHNDRRERSRARAAESDLLAERRGLRLVVDPDQVCSLLFPLT